jgi:hypothetical protein
MLIPRKYKFVRERKHLEDLGVDGKIIFQRLFKK